MARPAIVRVPCGNQRAGRTGHGIPTKIGIAPRLCSLPSELKDTFYGSVLKDPYLQPLFGVSTPEQRSPHRLHR